MLDGDLWPPSALALGSGLAPLRQLSSGSSHDSPVSCHWPPSSPCFSKRAYFVIVMIYLAGNCHVNFQNNALHDYTSYTRSQCRRTEVKPGSEPDDPRRLDLQVPRIRCLRVNFAIANSYIRLISDAARAHKMSKQSIRQRTSATSD